MINEKINDYLTWQKTEEGRKAGAPIINENHKEILFNNWDAKIKRVEKAAEEAATAANILTDCVNDNLHKAKFIPETVDISDRQINCKQNGGKRQKKEKNPSKG